MAHRGEGVDGHDYIANAITAGAIAVLGHDLEKLNAARALYPKITFLFSTNLLAAIQVIARCARRRYFGPLAAITGAVGKTTTKDLAAIIFASAVETLATELNDNNFWGVPKTLLKLRPSHRMAVLELGTNSLDELGVLPQICEPNVALVTAIAPTHLEGFGDIAGVLRAETEHLTWMADQIKQPIFILNLDDEHLRGFLAPLRDRLTASGKLITYSRHADTDADVRVTTIKPLGLESRFGYRFTYSSPWGSNEIELPLPGEFNIGNAVGAACLAHATGLVTSQQIARALSSAQITARRAEIFRAPRGCIVYNDSYNASPLALTSILNETKLIRSNPSAGVKTVIAVVGDMLELGVEAPAYHRDVGASAFKLGVDYLLAYGDFCAEYCSGFISAGGRNAQPFTDKNSLWQHLEKLLQPEPKSVLVVIKGSRGMKMWEVADKLR